jgi:hypothetical protein
MKNILFITTLFLLSCISLSAQPIAGVRMLRLSEYNLAKLGIRISDQGVYYTEKGNATSQTPKGNPARKVILTKNSVTIKTPAKKEIDDVLPFAPVFSVNVFKNGSAVFYANGKNKNYQFDSKGSLTTQPIDVDTEWANHLVCIYVEFTPKSNGKLPATNNQCYLWYKITTELLDYLPTDIAEPLWSEIFTPKQGFTESPTGHFTDSWRDWNAILTTKPLYPNPAYGKTTLDFTLSAQTYLSIAIYDVNGQKISDLITNQQYSSGNNSVQLPLDGISEGMYLVVITPYNEKPVVQRILIAR